MESLEDAPLPLTRPQRLVLWVTSLAVAVTRLAAVAATPWDWDEILFCLAVDDYDAAAHRPHPPGFPLFLGLAKLIRWFGLSDFRSLQILSMAAAMSLFPLLVALGRELRFSFPVAYGGALLVMFLPNVWLYGGTAFSDVLSLALTVGACACLLRGARSGRSLLAGALLLGLAASIRPQALLIGAAPSLVAVWKRRRFPRQVFAAIVLGAVVVAIAYCGAILASASVEEYLATARSLREYLRTVDSFLNPDRPPLRVLFEFFFVRTIPGDDRTRNVLLIAAIAGAIIATLRRDGKVWLLILIFLPFQIFAWLMLDYHSVTRYGMSYAPLYAILAAAAAIGLFAWIPAVGRYAGLAVVLILAARMARWSAPALAEVRGSDAPPAAAMKWIGGHVPRPATIYVHGSVMPYATLFLADRRTVLVAEPKDLGATPPGRDAVLVTELPLPVIGAKRFVRDRGSLFDIVRKRYFEVTAIPAQSWASFDEGWHAEEWVGVAVWRWMGARSRMQLPPATGPMRLSLKLEPVLEKGPPRIEVWLNGALIERLDLAVTTERTWTVPARSDSWNELIVVSDRFVNPIRDGLGQDGRDLSLRLLGYDWVPAQP